MKCDYCNNEALYHTQEPADVCLNCGITKDPACLEPVKKFEAKFSQRFPEISPASFRIITHELVKNLLVETGVWNKINH